MVFSSLFFIFAFLPCFLILYYISPQKWRNTVALGFSYIFYAWVAPIFVFVLLATSIIDYWISKGIKNNSNNIKQKKLLLVISLLINLGILAYAKYSYFFVSELSGFLSQFGFEKWHWTKIALPIGISFFTFQKISYIVDVYRGITSPAKNFTNYALYVALFPQLVAGPIVRYHDISQQITSRQYTTEKFLNGIYRFCLGLAKKVLIANVLGEVADKIFVLSPAEMTLPYAWIGIVAYALQIYFDFSGYSDMAIGLSSMLGFRLLENFNKPYIAKNVTEFWKRWHISLTNFMKEYLYVPLGGNRVTKLRLYLNLWIVFLLSGLWHGANWTFIVWGIYHGFFLMIDRMFWLRVTKKLPGWFLQIFTFFLITISWVFFRAVNIEYAWGFMHRLFSLHDTIPPILWSEIINNRAIVIFILAMLICFLPGWPRLVEKMNTFWPPLIIKHDKDKEKISFNDVAVSKLVHISVKFGFSIILFFLCILSLANSTYNPFIYFRF